MTFAGFGAMPRRCVYQPRFPHPDSVMRKILMLDCDSTLSAIEGVDELARIRGDAVFQAVEDMTNAAMNGGTPIQDVFARRLDMIRPTRHMTESVAAMYYATRAAGVESALAAVRGAGWTPVVVSGGFCQAILPFAERLGMDRVEAVDLKFDADGAYAGFDESAPTARSGGKPDVARALRAEFPGCTLVMVGDGASDMECSGVTDLFIGFGGFVARPAVKAGAEAFILHFDELAPLLARRFA